MKNIELKMASSGERDEKRLEVESKRESVATPDEVIQRQTLHAKDLCFMQYGEVPPDHPVYEYVNKIAGKLQGDDKFQIKIRVIPDKFQSNAFAFPDGTIVITSHLLEFAEYYEALAGAIAHEKVHIEKEHAKKVDDIASSDYQGFFELGLKRLGRKRINEYEADLRSVFSYLEKANINPLGLKILLQKFAQRENDSDYSDTHGSSMDRALNIATGSYLMDLKALSSDLTPIPAELTGSLKNVPPPEFGAIFSRPKDYSGFIKPYEQRIKERRDAISRVKEPDQILVALSAVNNYVKEKKSPDYDQDDDRCREELIKKAILYLEDKLGLKNKMATTFIVGYFSGVSIDIIDNCHPDEKNEPISLSEVIEIIKKVVVAKPFKYALSSFHIFRQDFAGYLNKHGLIKNGDDNSIKNLDQAFFSLESAYSLNKPDKGSSINATSQILSKEEPSIKADEETPEGESIWVKTSKSEFDINPRAIKILKNSIKVYNPEIIYKSLPKIKKNFLAELGNGDIDDLYQLLAIVGNAMNELSERLVLRSKESQGSKTDEMLGVVERYILANIFSYCANKKGLINKIGNKQYEMYRLLVNYELEVDTLQRGISDLKKRHMPHSEPEDSNESEHTYGTSGQYDYDDSEGPDLDEVIGEVERENHFRDLGGSGIERENSVGTELTESEIEVINGINSSINRHKVNEKLFFTSVDREMVLDAYNVFVDEEYRDQHKFGGLNLGIGTAADRGEIFFVRLMDIYAASVPLKEFIDFINENQKNREYFVPTLTSHSELLGNISLAVAKACEDGTLWDIPLADLVIISNLVNNPFIRNEILSNGLNKHWAILSFDEKSDLLFPEKGKKGIVDFNLREKFLCEEVKTREQYQKIRQTVERSIDDLFSTTSVGIGEATLVDRIGFKYSNLVELLDSALITSSDDRRLREWIYDYIVSQARSFDEEEQVLLSEGETETEELIGEKIMQQLYTLDEVGRRMFTRKLLVSQDGLLRSEGNRKKFFNAVFKTWLAKEKGQEELSGVLEKIKGGLAEEKSWELLYFGIQGILSDKIFIPPKEKEKKKLSERSVSAVGARPFERQRDKVLLAEMKIRDAFITTGVAKPRKQKISPVEFVKETAGNLGALGRRFLQILPQFVDLSPEYEREFSDVYDKVAGQSKFAAIATVEREWPEVWNEFKEIGERVGGGSIVTVFHAVTKDGREEVLKVRNPNILYHLDEAEKVVTSISERLASQYGGAYEQARNIIPDISMWVTNDVNFEGFLEKDAQFRQQYQGFTVEGNQYKIRIPESFGPQNAYFSREEYVPGINLTSIDEIIGSDKHNAKQAIGLLAKFYVQQIMSGRLHSDIHPGNFAVTDKNELVVYDRNYYIDLTNEEKEAILSLFNPFEGEDKKAELMQKLLNAGDDNAPLLNDFVSALSRGEIEEAKKGVIKIKASGVTVPLNITLLLKNISSIQSLAKKVGFSNVFEAVLT